MDSSFYILSMILAEMESLYQLNEMNDINKNFKFASLSVHL